jgi:hypothetical protein
MPIVRSNMFVEGGVNTNCTLKSKLFRLIKFIRVQFGAEIIETIFKLNIDLY